MYDLVILGGGPAAVTAAIYAARKKMNFAVVTLSFGGQLNQTTVVENYTSYKLVTGAELARKFEEHMKEFAFDVVQDEIREVRRAEMGFEVVTWGKTLQTKTLLITTGSMPKKLGIAGEEEFMSRGVTYCATCDGPLYEGKDVVIAGGGNTGATAALQMSRIARKVYFTDRGNFSRADRIIMDKIRASNNIEIYPNTVIKQIRGKKLVESVVMDVAGKEMNVHVDGVFINIGHNPNIGFIKDLVELNEYGEIKVDRHNMTSVEGIFAAGDVTDIPHKQIIIAAGEGASAIMSIYDYLSRHY